MPSKIRVFVSSTMKDLANERDAVVRKINEFNFEPVNAEGWLPNGSRSWERIHQEILSSHLFILISGERYGWIPDEGPGGSDGLSVTHMEVNAARAAEIPILPFLKRLDYDSDRTSDDARKRDAFRREIGRWVSGYFFSEFALASELSAKIGAALVTVLSESYLNSEVQKRSMLAVPAEGETREQERSDLILDPLLIDLIEKRQIVLLAGAGMSLRAGFPSSRALTELIVSQVQEHGDDFSQAALSGPIQGVAENFELAYGRGALLKIILKALSAPQGIEPTRAHRLSVRLFDRILTTNFDRLFEMACEEAGIEYQSILGDVEIPPDFGGALILRLAGMISAPESLIITARDAMGMRQKRPRFWQSLTFLMKTHPVVVVGHSLHDLNARGLLESSGADGRRNRGFIVAPDIGSFDRLRFASQGFQVIKSDADSFFGSVASSVGLTV